MKNKTSKYVGVSWHKRNCKWISCIIINGESKHLGYFTNQLEASKFYKAAKNAIKKNEQIITNKPKQSSKYRGVQLIKQENKWIAVVRIKGKAKRVGTFNCETSAYFAHQKEILAKENKQLKKEL